MTRRSPDRATEDARRRPERSWFGLWRHLDLVHGGRTFLRRRGLDGARLRLGGILVHWIDDRDPGIDLHDHPWPFVSVVLRGAYTEEWSDTRDACARAAAAEEQETYHAGQPWRPAYARRRGWAYRGDTRTWRRWSIHRMPLHVAHRIVDVEPGTVTLVLRGRKRRPWGFYLPTGWVPWDDGYDYETRRPSEVTSSHPEEDALPTSRTPSSPSRPSTSAPPSA